MITLQPSFIHLSRGQQLLSGFLRYFCSTQSSEASLPSPIQLTVGDQPTFLLPSLSMPPSPTHLSSEILFCQEGSRSSFCQPLFAERLPTDLGQAPGLNRQGDSHSPTLPNSLPIGTAGQKHGNR